MNVPVPSTHRTWQRDLEKGQQSGRGALQSWEETLRVLGATLAPGMLKLLRGTSRHDSRKSVSSLWVVTRMLRSLLSWDLAGWLLILAAQKPPPPEVFRPCHSLRMPVTDDRMLTRNWC